MMKELLTALLSFGMFSFYACGPSAGEKAVAEKARQDSIAATQAAVQAAEAAIQEAQENSAEIIEQQEQEAMTDSSRTTGEAAANNPAK